MVKLLYTSGLCYRCEGVRLFEAVKLCQGPLALKGLHGKQTDTSMLRYFFLSHSACESVFLETTSQLHNQF